MSKSIRVYEIEPATLPRRCIIWTCRDSLMADRACIEMGKVVEEDETSRGLLIVPHGKMFAREKFGPIVRELTSQISGKEKFDLLYTPADNYLKTLSEASRDGFLVAWFSDQDKTDKEWRKEVVKTCAEMKHFIIVLHCSAGIHHNTAASFARKAQELLDLRGNKSAVDYLVIRDSNPGVINLEPDGMGGTVAKFVPAVPRIHTRLRNPDIRNW